MTKNLHGLCAVTPANLQPDDLIYCVKVALQHGLRFVLYRDKTSLPKHKMQIGEELLVLCEAAGALLIINDNIELCCKINAHGVHLSDALENIAEVKERLGVDAQGAPKIVGISCYNDLSLALNAAQNGADYVAFGSVFTSPTNPKAPRAPLSLFAEFRAQSNLPVCAMGGITPENAPSVVNAGANIIAVLTDLLSSDHLSQQVSAFNACFEKHSENANLS